jgi:hypothetical protein
VSQPRSVSAETLASLDEPRLARLQTSVYETLRMMRTFGATVDELEKKLNLSHQTCSPRVLELRQKGLVVDSGKRRLTRSGRRARVWVHASFRP